MSAASDTATGGDHPSRHRDPSSPASPAAAPALGEGTPDALLPDPVKPQDHLAVPAHTIEEQLSEERGASVAQTASLDAQSNDGAVMQKIGQNLGLSPEADAGDASSNVHGAAQVEGIISDGDEDEASLLSVLRVSAVFSSERRDVKVPLEDDDVPVATVYSVLHAAFRSTPPGGWLLFDNLRALVPFNSLTDTVGRVLQNARLEGFEPLDEAVLHLVGFSGELYDNVEEFVNVRNIVRYNDRAKLPAAKSTAGGKPGKANASSALPVTAAAVKPKAGNELVWEGLGHGSLLPELRLQQPANFEPEEGLKVLTDLAVELIDCVITSKIAETSDGALDESDIDDEINAMFSNAMKRGAQEGNAHWPLRGSAAPDITAWTNILENSKWSDDPHEPLLFSPANESLCGSMIWAYARLARMAKNSKSHATENGYLWEYVNFVSTLCLDFAHLLAHEVDRHRPARGQQLLEQALIGLKRHASLPEHLGIREFRKRLPHLLDDPEHYGLSVVVLGATKMLEEDAAALDAMWKLNPAQVVVEITAEQALVELSWERYKALEEAIVDPSGSTPAPRKPPINLLTSVHFVEASDATLSATKINVVLVCMFHEKGERLDVVRNRPEHTFILTRRPSDVARHLIATRVPGIGASSTAELIKRRVVPLQLRSWRDMIDDVSAQLWNQVAEQRIRGPAAGERVLTPPHAHLLKTWGTVVHKDIANQADLRHGVEDPSQEEQMTEADNRFAMGEPAAWLLFKMTGVLVPRDDLEELKHMIEQKAVRVQGLTGTQGVNCVDELRVEHEPGTGASTIGRHALFTLRSQFPCVVAHDLSKTDEIKASIPVLTITENGLIATVILVDDARDMQYDNFINCLRRLRLPVVVVRLVRVQAVAAVRAVASAARRGGGNGGRASGRNVNVVALPQDMNTFKLASSLSEPELLLLDRAFGIVSRQSKPLREYITDFERAWANVDGRRAAPDNDDTDLALPKHFVYYGLCRFGVQYNIREHLHAWLQGVGWRNRNAAGAMMMPEYLEGVAIICLVSGFTNGKRALTEADFGQLFPGKSFAVLKKLWKETQTTVVDMSLLIRSGDFLLRPYHPALGRALAVELCGDRVGLAAVACSLITRSVHPLSGTLSGALSSLFLFRDELNGVSRASDANGAGEPILVETREHFSDLVQHLEEDARDVFETLCQQLALAQAEQNWQLRFHADVHFARWLDIVAKKPDMSLKRLMVYVAARSHKGQWHPLSHILHCVIGDVLRRNFGMQNFSMFFRDLVQHAVDLDKLNDLKVAAHMYLVSLWRATQSKRPFGDLSLFLPLSGLLQLATAGALQEHGCDAVSMPALANYETGVNEHTPFFAITDVLILWLEYAYHLLVDEKHMKALRALAMRFAAAVLRNFSHAGTSTVEGALYRWLVYASSGPFYSNEDCRAAGYPWLRDKAETELSHLVKNYPKMISTGTAVPDLLVRLLKKHKLPPRTRDIGIDIIVLLQPAENRLYRLLEMAEVWQKKWRRAAPPQQYVTQDGTVLSTEFGGTSAARSPVDDAEPASDSELEAAEVANGNAASDHDDQLPHEIFSYKNLQHLRKLSEDHWNGVHDVRALYIAKTGCITYEAQRAMLVKAKRMAGFYAIANMEDYLTPLASGIRPAPVFEHAAVQLTCVGPKVFVLDE